MITRREFIIKAGSATIAAAFLPHMNLNKKNIETGLILYTLRDEMAKDPQNTLKKVAEIGYNWIETADYNGGLFYNQKPAEFRNNVESLGLKWISCHAGVNINNVDKVVDDAAEGGLKYIVLPSLTPAWRNSLDGYKEAAGFFNIAGEKCKKAGMKFVFHNHKNEFKKTNGEIPYDLLISNTDPDLVTFELDLCWITAAGLSAAGYMSKYPGRFELFHMKDMSANKKDATLGEGIIDFKLIFSLTKSAGMKYFFVEQDKFRTHSPIESIKISRDFLIDHFLE